MDKEIQRIQNTMEEEVMERRRSRSPRNLSVGAAGKHRAPRPGSAHPVAEVSTVKLLHIANHLSSGAKEGQ